YGDPLAMHSRSDILPTLGPLEIHLLQLLWTDGPQTARQAYETLRLQRVIAYTTVAKTLDRLASKDVLHRDFMSVGRGQALCYTPLLTRSQMLAHIVTQALAVFGADATD